MSTLALMLSLLTSAVGGGCIGWAVRDERHEREPYLTPCCECGARGPAMQPTHAFGWVREHAALTGHRMMQRLEP